MTIYVEEFLYRGRPSSSNTPEAWHVVLGEEIQNSFGKTQLDSSGPMTPAQAKAQGFDLPAILAAINTAVMNQLTLSQANETQLTADKTALTAQLATAQAQITSLQTSVTQLTANATALQTQLDTANAANAALQTQVTQHATALQAQVKQNAALQTQVQTQANQLSTLQDPVQ